VKWFVTALVGLSAIAANTASAAAAAEPDLTTWKQTFVGCKLEDVKSSLLSIKSFNCGPEQGDVHLEADSKTSGFVEVLEGSEGPMRITKIRAFRKAADAPIDAILQDVRAASPGRNSETCVFTPTTDGDDGAKRWAFAPGGSAAESWTQDEKSGDPVDPPCGALGVQFEGDLYFEVLPDDPTIVVFVDAGSEIQIFVPATLKSVAAH
jgi:hypothetical protein